MVHWSNKNNAGQSLLELILAVAVFAVAISALVSLVTGSFTGLSQAGEHTEAEALVKEGIEAVRAIHDNEWNRLRYATSSIATSTNGWFLTGSTTPEEIGQYTRTITINDVCRDTDDDITACPSSYIDPHTKEVTVTVSWEVRAGIDNSVSASTYLTNWDSRDWTQTDWSGGEGQGEWSVPNKYQSDNGNLATSSSPGQLSLLNGELIDTGFDVEDGATSHYDWPFTTDTNYSYDTNKMTVTGGVAKLLVATTTLAGETKNVEFATSSDGWTFYDWSDSGNSVDGSYQAAGGNPDGYIDIAIDEVKNKTLSGYLEQDFVTTADNPNTATLDLDWIVSQYDDTFITSFQVYVFVDSAAGTPTLGQEVWSSGEITGTTGWNSVATIDVSSSLGTAGTYYVKVASRVVTRAGGGRARGVNTVGFDNIDLYWEGSDLAYPTDKPSIYPNDSFTVTGPGYWSGFTETATKGTGEIYYQLSDDDGSTWQYWDGAVWTSAGASDYNDALTIDAHINTFNAGNEQLLFKAFLESDGQQQVELDNVNVAFTESGSPWSFATWGIEPSEEIPTGVQHSTGGNPDGYVDVTVQNGTNDEVGGVWSQSFTNYATNPTPVTLDLDYRVFDYNGTPNVADIRVYVDTAPGDPVNQVGSSIGVTAEGGWTSASQYDLSGSVNSSGTYYLKIVFYVETGVAGGSGPFTVGFDNVVLDLGNGGHPLSGTLLSSAYDMGDSSPVQVIEWDEVTPSCTPACTVEFEISTAPDDAGTPGTWTDWYGVSGSGDTFITAAGSMVPIDMNGNQWVRYRTTLTGDGDDTPILQEVRINYR